AAHRSKHGSPYDFRQPDLLEFGTKFWGTRLTCTFIIGEGYPYDKTARSRWFDSLRVDRIWTRTRLGRGSEASDCVLAFAVSAMQQWSGWTLVRDRAERA